MKAAARAVFMKAVVRCTAAVGAVLTVEADTAVKAKSHGAAGGNQTIIRAVVY